MNSLSNSDVSASLWAALPKMRLRDVPPGYLVLYPAPYSSSPFFICAGNPFVLGEERVSDSEQTHIRIQDAWGNEEIVPADQMVPAIPASKSTMETIDRWVKTGYSQIVQENLDLKSRIGRLESLLEAHRQTAEKI